MKNLFLHNYHSDNGAEYNNIEEYNIPINYGNVLNEIDAINNTLGLLDRSYLGKILVKGKDSLDLLNRISTNDLQYLSIGTACDTIFVTPKGRMVDYCRIINIGEDQFILICSFIGLFLYCAYKVAPSGGPEDKTPPEIVRHFPQSDSVGIQHFPFIEVEFTCL